MSLRPTVELLDALDVIVRKSEVFGEGVNGGHQRSGVLRVLQTKGMTELMGCHQEQTVAFKTQTKLLHCLQVFILLVYAIRFPLSSVKCGKSLAPSHLDRDKSPICGRHHSSWWWHTTSCHRCVQMRCRSRKCFPGK